MEFGRFVIFRVWRALYLLLPGLILMVVVDGGSALAWPKSDNNSPRPFHRLIVELSGKPMAAVYDEDPELYGKPDRRRLAVKSRAAARYLRRLAREQDAFVAHLRSLGTGVKVSRRRDSRSEMRENRYRLLFNGVALDCGGKNPEDLRRRLEGMSEVKAVYSDRAYYPQLYASRKVINASVLWHHPLVGSYINAGRGVKIAIMDGGIHHQAPMFDGRDFSFPPDLPAPGLGDARNNNGKIIVSRAYFRADDPPEAGDGNVWPGENGTSHGVHVAGIAAGNPVRADYLGLSFDLSGVAPAAWLMSYRVFYPAQSGKTAMFTAEALAALEDIVADGADIVNCSWGSGPESAGGYYDPLDRALLNAWKAGVFVVVPAGNAGPGSGTIDHPSREYACVGASSTNSSLAQGSLSVVGPGLPGSELKNMEVRVADFGPVPALDESIYELITAASVDPGNAKDCSAWIGNPFSGRAVLIERGDCYFSDKIYFAQEAGAALVIIYNHEPGGEELVDMYVSSHEGEITIPSVFIKRSDGLHLRDWFAAHGAASRIRLSRRAFKVAVEPDRLYGNSSRGPGVGGTLKPDITAPGVDILSQGYTPYAEGEARHLGYGQASGTSMATPHVAGAAALIRQVHPDWPNSYIKSALMTTAEFRLLKTVEGRPVLPLEIGAGRLDLRRAADPGIVCLPQSFSFGRITRGERRSLTLTVTNVTDRQESYEASVFCPERELAGVSISPVRLVMKPCSSATLTLTIDTMGTDFEIGDLQGWVVLNGAVHQAHLPFWGRVVKAPETEILLIDNDGSSQGDYEDYRSYYSQALRTLHRSFDVWDVDAQPADRAIPEAAFLAQYPTIVYFTGDHDGGGLPAWCSDRLTEYANGGGRLIAMGQDLSQLFDQDGMFFSYILGGHVWLDNLTDDSLPSLKVVGHDEAPSVFRRVSLDLGSGGDGAANQLFMDEMLSSPWSDGFYNYLKRESFRPLLRYPGREVEDEGTVALLHRAQPGLGVPEPPYAGRSIYASFGLEGVNNLPGSYSRHWLLGMFLDCLSDDPAVEIVEQDSSTAATKNFHAHLFSPVGSAVGVSYLWDFGDGTPRVSSAAESTVSHTYDRAGNFLARVEVEDSWGNRALGDWLVARSDALYYPHVATTLDWETEICLINLSSTSVLSGEFKAYAHDGSLVTVLKEVGIPPRGRREITVGDEFANSDRIAYIVFESVRNEIDAVGYIKFYRPGIYRVAVPAIREINRGDMFIPHIASGNGWFTGISLVNVTETPRVLFVETDNGLKRFFELAPGEHKALSINTLFANQLQPGVHSALIRNSAGIIGLELFGSTDSGSQLSGILLRDRSATEIIYPHVAAGSWWTGVVAYNCGTETGQLKFTTFSGNGDILENIGIDLPAHSRYIGSASGLGFDPETAWFRVKTSQPITGFELFGDDSGLQLAGYSGVGISSSSGIFAKLDRQGYTGIAMVNTSLIPVQVVFKARADDGDMIALRRINLAGYEKVVKTAQELFTTDISDATYVSYEADGKIAGFQLNGSYDGIMLDSLPALH